MEKRRVFVRYSGRERIWKDNKREWKRDNDNKKEGKTFWNFFLWLIEFDKPQDKKNKPIKIKVIFKVSVVNVEIGYIFILKFFLSQEHRCTQGGEGGIIVYPPSKIFAKLVNKNAIKH